MSEISFTLNGNRVLSNGKESLLDICKRLEIALPNLCYHPKQRIDANCRSCMVEIKGERTLAPACRRKPSNDMQVSTHSARAKSAQQAVLQLLNASVSQAEYTQDNALHDWQAKTNPAPRSGSSASATASPKASGGASVNPHQDNSHPAIDFHADACILCTRCVRACREVQVNNIIGIKARGDKVQVVFDLDDPLGESGCVGCGECVQACPTGALSNKGDTDLISIDKTVDSVCPYCGVGCLLRYHVSDNKIIKVTGRDGPANHRKLCVKGRYGFDYIHHPERLSKPLIRLPGIDKGLNDAFDPANPLKMFREASWEEALALASNGLRQIRDANEGGRQALAGFGSAKGSNEEAYLFQKLVRLGFGNNNVDHCTRLCHASSVAALLEGIGSGAVSNQVEDIKHSDVIFIIGSNTTSNHPVAATFIKQAKKAGKTLIVIDPRRIEIAKHADYFLQFKPDSDVALLNALLHVIIDENLIDKAFIAARTTDFEMIKQNVAALSPEKMTAICGVAADDIREVARVYAKAKNAIIFWGMGVSQHIHGTDNVRCLISLCLLCGQIGRPGTGLHPLRGQNNVQGASDAGLIPMMLPDYQRVDDASVRAHFESAWQQTLNAKPGLTVVEIMHAIHAGSIKGLYIMGENPAMSDPNLNKTRAALAKLEHLVVQDIFLTETAAFADVVLPATAWPEKTGTVTNTDRRVQMGRQAIAAPGDAKPDAWIIQQIAQGLDCKGFDLSTAETFEEMRKLMPTIAGITWARVEAQDSITYPCETEKDQGQGTVFIHDFPTDNGKAKLVPAQYMHAAELPDEAYPFILITGRRLEHWHTGSMTRRAKVLDEIEPVPIVDIHPQDIKNLNLSAGTLTRIASRRGELNAYVRASDNMQQGEVFLPFCYIEAAANLLTNEALDPVGKIPEFKFCAVKLTAN